MAAEGRKVYRVNFHGGDQLFWPLPGGINYRGTEADWPAWIEAKVVSLGITEIVLFGDCRPRHRAAVAVARRLQVPVHVFEEGYIRPNWVTLELGGVNGHSPLPRDPDWYREHAIRLAPVPASVGAPSSFFRRAAEDVAYNFGYMLLAWTFPFYRTHRPWHPAVEYAAWAARLVRRRVTRSRIAAEVQAAASLPNIFIFPLQLDCDSQVRTHSSFGGLTPAIEMVLQSFATHAPPGATLVIKEHPLDNGMRNWRKLVNQEAARLCIAARVRFIEDGDLQHITARAAGMVTINSTSGTLALAAGIPVITLGQALYDMPGLTFKGSLDAFWTSAAPPDAALFEAFRRVLAHRSLIQGGFYTTGDVDQLVASAVARLETLQPANPVPHMHTGRDQARTGRVAPAAG